MLDEIVNQQTSGLQAKNSLNVLIRKENVYGPYASTAAAKAAVLLADRYDGLTVKLTNGVEYWWLGSDLTDTGLIQKGGGGTITSMSDSAAGETATIEVDVAGDGSVMKFEDSNGYETQIALNAAGLGEVNSSVPNWPGLRYKTSPVEADMTSGSMPPKSYVDKKAALAIKRWVYLVGDAGDAARLGGTGANVYTTAQTAYTAADALQVGLGANQVVGIMVLQTVTTINNGQYTSSVGGITLSAAWNAKVFLIGVSPRVSMIDFILAENASGNGYAVDLTAMSMRIGNQGGSRCISTRATGTSGNSGAITLRIDNCSLNNGILTDISNAGNTAGNGGGVTIATLGSPVFSESPGMCTLGGSITTSARSGGSGSAGVVSLSSWLVIMGGITTANNCAGGNLTITNFRSFVYVFGAVTFSSTTTSGSTCTLRNVEFAGAVNINIAGTITISACDFTGNLNATNNGNGTTAVNVTNVSVSAFSSNAAAITTGTQFLVAGGITTLGDNSNLSNCTLKTAASAPVINGIGTGCVLNNCVVTGGNASIDNGSAVTVTLNNTHIQFNTGSNVTVQTEVRPIKRVKNITVSATPTINTDVTDVAVITGQNANISSFTTNLTGTARPGDLLRININATGVFTIAWGARFSGSLLPSATVNGDLRVYLEWDVASSTWFCNGAV